MSTTVTAKARVIKVVSDTKRNTARTRIDIVHLDYQGGLYTWSTDPGMYAAGDEVAVNPPARVGANITPA